MFIGNLGIDLQVLEDWKKEQAVKNKKVGRQISRSETERMSKRILKKADKDKLKQEEKEAKEAPNRYII